MPKSQDDLPSHDSTMSFLALGDSYTIGQSVASSENFPNQTVNILRVHHLTVSDPDIIATTGWTTSDLLSAISAAPHRTYSYVTLLIGVNNQYQGRSIEEYKNEFMSLLESAISYAGNTKKHVYVLSIPDYSVTPFARKLDTSKIANEIDLYNAINKKIALQLGVNYLDITPISRESENDPLLMAADGLHPSGIQYKKWAFRLAQMIMK
jgi:Lysophospholipase L1 and related esterases